MFLVYISEVLFSKINFSAARGHRSQIWYFVEKDQSLVSENIVKIACLCFHGWNKQVLSSSWDGRSFGHNRHERKIRGLYLRTKWHLDPSNKHYRKLGKLALHLTQCGLGRGLPPCQVLFWSIQPFSHNTPTSQPGQRDRTGQRVQHRANLWTDERRGESDDRPGHKSNDHDILAIKSITEISVE